MGGPVAVEIGNTEWPKWDQVMSADPVDPVELEALARNAAADPAAARARRPGGHAEVRLRRGPARPRARLGPRDRGPRRARSGRRQLPPAGRRRDRGLPRGRARAAYAAPAGLVPDRRRRGRAGRRPGALPRPDASEKMVAAIDQAHQDGDTLGGVVEVVVHGLPPGLGSHVHWDRRIDAKPGRRPDGHPGDQGRRGRRRVRARGHARARGRTTRSCPPMTGSAASAATPAAPRAA